MHEITIICTVHTRNGKCNPSGLVRILDTIGPEVLFLEIPYFQFIRDNNLKSRNILEINAISEYIELQQVIQVPVDTLGPSPFKNDKFDQVIRRAYNISTDLRQLLEHQAYLENLYGFEYLNSRASEATMRRVDAGIQRVLQEINDEKLSASYEEWKDHNEKRDEVMIRNVYDFCIQHQFQRGAFIFGSGHRQSIIGKIQRVKKSEEPHLNWRLRC